MSYPDPQFSSIAIVDDDAAVRVGLRSLLRSYGYEAHAYDSALAFLASGAQGDYHCIITDLLPVILMTAFPEAALRKRAFQGGASCFLSKPFEANELLLCLKQASGNHNATAKE